jgi:regulator of replication initiation timing
MVCEFCQCELGADGSYKALSETARTYRDMKEKNERLAETNAVLQREKEELERKVREMTPTPAARRESLRL